jgi:hypothetical protein
METNRACLKDNQDGESVAINVEFQKEEGEERTHL